MIWRSWEDIGILAVTEILTDPGHFPETKAEKKYWIPPANGDGEVLRVKMRVLKVITNNPVLKSTIRDLSGLGNLSIIKMPRATNFGVKFNEWIIIKQLIEKIS